MTDQLGPDSLRAAIAKRWLEDSLRDTLAAHADAWEADIKKATYLNRCEKRYHYFVGPGRCWCGKATLPPEDSHD